MATAQDSRLRTLPEYRPPSKGRQAGAEALSGVRARAQERASGKLPARRPQKGIPGRDSPKRRAHKVLYIKGLCHPGTLGFSLFDFDRGEAIRYHGTGQSAAIFERLERRVFPVVSDPSSPSVRASARSEDLWGRVQSDLGRDASSGETHWAAHLDVISCSPRVLVLRTNDAGISTGQLQSISDAFLRVCGRRPQIQIRTPRSQGGLTVTCLAEPGAAAGPPWHGEPPRPNELFTFERFTVGPFNALAHAAATAVCDAPGSAYNPLYVHASAGLGKTHLLHAACHRLRARHPDAAVCLVSGGEFQSDLRAATRVGDLESFHAAYRSADVLLVDDIQGMARDPGTQEEFFHTLESLQNSGKQLILSAGAAPQDLRAMDPRLVSRFQGGLVASIEPPGLETRLEIVDRKARGRSAALPPDVVRLLATHVQANIRELEGAVMRLIGYASMLRRPVDMVLARQVIDGVDPQTTLPKPVQVEDIRAEVCETYNLTLEQMTGRSRTRAISLPRQIAMYLARVLTKHSLEEIGSFFGGRDHSTVKHAYDKIRNRMDARPELKRVIKSLRNKLLSR